MINKEDLQYLSALMEADIKHTKDILSRPNNAHNVYFLGWEDATLIWKKNLDDLIMNSQ